MSRYGKKGWIEDFSSGLNTGRWHHGCASYIAKDNERVLHHVILNKQSIQIIVAGVAGHWGLGLGWSLQGKTALYFMDIKSCVSFTELRTLVLYLGVFVIGKNTPQSKISRVK